MPNHLPTIAIIALVGPLAVCVIAKALRDAIPAFLELQQAMAKDLDA